MRSPLTVTKISFRPGEALELQPNERVVVVGPNNSGKTVLLSAIRSSIESDGQNPPIASIEFERSITNRTLVEFAESVGAPCVERGGRKVFHLFGHTVSDSANTAHYASGIREQIVQKALLRYLPIDTRLNAGSNGFSSASRHVLDQHNADDGARHGRFNAARGDSFLPEPPASAGAHA